MRSLVWLLLLLASSRSPWALHTHYQQQIRLGGWGVTLALRAAVQEPVSPPVLLGQGWSRTGPDERKSKYSPVKRRLRPFGADNNKNTTTNAPPSLSADGRDRPRPLTAGNNGWRGGGEQRPEQHERSSFTISRILMQARQGEANVVVEMLSDLLRAQSTTKQAAVTLKEFNLLIKELGDNGHLDHCEHILALMVSSGVVPSVVTYSTLISRAGTWQKVSLAEAYFARMVAAGINADLQSHNCLVNAYVKSGQPDKAFEMIGIMDAARPRIFPNIVTFNTLIDSHARSGEVAKARSILEMMRLRGIEPNALTFSSLIHACCQANAVEEAFALMERMEREKIEPTDVTFSVLLHGLGQAGDLPRAFEVLEGMKRRGLKPNVVTMSSLVHACGKHGQLDRAFALYKEMGFNKDARYQPNSITCSSLIDACLKSGEVDRAFSVVQDMRARRLPMTQVTYTSLITELTKLRRLDRIMEVMRDDGDVVLHQADGAAARGSMSVARSFFPSSARSLSSAVSLNLNSEATTSKATNAEEKESVSRLMASFTSFLAQRHQNETLSADFSRILHDIESVGAALKILDQRCLGADQDPSVDEDRALRQGIAVAGQFDLVETARLLQAALDLPASMSWDQEALLSQACRHVLQGFGRASRLLKLLHACQVFQGGDAGAEVSRHYDFSWTVDTYSILESSAREFRSKYSYTIEAYQWMKDKQVTPCARIYNELLRVLNEKSNVNDIGVDDRALPQRRKQLKNDELFRLYLVFQEMRDGAVRLDAATYNTLINACAAAGDLDRAQETVAAMQEEGVLPDVITYTSLIKACSNSAAPGAVQLAEHYFSEMQQRSNHFSTYMEPTVYTYLQLMKAHLRAVEAGAEGGGEADALRIWELMEDLLRRRLTPNLRLWRMCVVASLIEGRIQKALGLLVVIREQQGRIDIKSWLACADYCARVGMEKEASLLRQEIKMNN